MRLKSLTFWKYGKQQYVNYKLLIQKYIIKIYSVSHLIEKSYLYAYSNFVLYINKIRTIFPDLTDIIMYYL